MSHTWNIFLVCAYYMNHIVFMKTSFPLPGPVKAALKKLGADIRDARRRRRIPTTLMAERAFISRATLGRLEKGDPRVSFGSYATVLFVLGLTDSLRNLVDANNDPVGRTLEEERLPKRIHRPKSYEWYIDKRFYWSVCLFKPDVSTLTTQLFVLRSEDSLLSMFTDRLARGSSLFVDRNALLLKKKCVKENCLYDLFREEWVFARVHTKTLPHTKKSPAAHT